MMKFKLSSVETRGRWRHQLREFEHRLTHNLNAWEKRSAINAEHRCERIGAAIRRGAKRCLGRR